MDEEKIKNTFEDKYEELLGITYDEWQENGPKNQEEAFARASVIDNELNATYDDWYEATGEKKEELGEYRDRLKGEYDFLVDAFSLEEEDRSW